MCNLNSLTRECFARREIVLSLCSSLKAEHCQQVIVHEYQLSLVVKHQLKINQLSLDFLPLDFLVV